MVLCCIQTMNRRKNMAGCENHCSASVEQTALWLDVIESLVIVIHLVLRIEYTLVALQLCFAYLETSEFVELNYLGTKYSNVAHLYREIHEIFVAFK